MESSWAKDAINVSRPSALNIPVAYTVAECQYSKAATESDLLLIYITLQNMVDQK